MRLDELNDIIADYFARGYDMDTFTVQKWRDAVNAELGCDAEDSFAFFGRADVAWGGRN